MAQTLDHGLRRIGIFACIIVGGLLLAHSINAFVADALHVVPELRAGKEVHDAALPVSYSPAQYAEDVRSSGLFTLPPPAQEQRNHSDSVAAVRASLGAASRIRLIGIVMGDHRGVFAIVEELASKRQALYRLHDQIPDLGEVTDIVRNGMVIRKGNLEELLELELLEKPISSGHSTTPITSASTIQAPGASLRKVIDRREVELAMNDLPKLLTQARAVPNMVNGTLNGFRIDYMAPASFYEKIGVQTGDILQRVNGVDIRDPSTLLNLLQQLKNEQVVKLDLVRNNQPSTVTYELR